MNEAWKQNWIANKENWCIIANQIPNAIIRVEFNSKTAWVAYCIGRATFTANRWKTNSNRRLLTNMAEEFSGWVLLNLRICYFKITEGTSSLCLQIKETTNWLACTFVAVALAFNKTLIFLTWTTRSGIRSRSKCDNSSKKLTSCSSNGPRSPTDNVASLTPIGAPDAVVATDSSYNPNHKIISPIIHGSKNSNGNFQVTFSVFVLHSFPMQWKQVFIMLRKSETTKRKCRSKKKIRFSSLNAVVRKPLAQ